MQTKRIWIIGLSLCLLSMQLSGLHLHVSIDSVDGTTHHPHLHQADPDDQHETDVDVDLTGAGITWKKYSFILSLLSFALLVIYQISTQNRVSHTQRLSACGNWRWRPPLRAPPQPFLIV